jgi:hypothetical protein
MKTAQVKRSLMAVSVPKQIRNARPRRHGSTSESYCSHSERVSSRITSDHTRLTVQNGSRKDSHGSKNGGLETAQRLLF